MAVITNLGVQAGVLDAAMVAAGILSVMAYPLLAMRVSRSTPRTVASAQ